MDKQYSSNLEIVKDILKLRKQQKKLIKEGKNADDIGIIKASIKELYDLLETTEVRE
jgi:hypothetical protein